MAETPGDTLESILRDGPERWLVLGGWSLPPDILAPSFPPGTALVDTNILMPRLVMQGELRPDWAQRAADALAARVPTVTFGLAGWSMGAMVAWAVAPHAMPERVVLLSATPSFCRRPEFRHGTRASVLTAMRSALATDRSSVLRDFQTRCGLGGPVASESSTDQLDAGLLFLEQASLLPLKPLGVPVRFVHGRADQIVPFEAGRKFAELTGAPMAQVEAGHAFFADMGRAKRDVF